MCSCSGSATRAPTVATARARSRRRRHFFWGGGGAKAWAACAIPKVIIIIAGPQGMYSVSAAARKAGSQILCSRLTSQGLINMLALLCQYIWHLCSYTLHYLMQGSPLRGKEERKKKKKKKKKTPLRSRKGSYVISL